MFQAHKGFTINVFVFGKKHVIFLTIFWGNSFFSSVNSTNHANFLEKNHQIYNITKLRKK